QTTDTTTAKPYSPTNLPDTTTRPPTSTLFPYTTLFRSPVAAAPLRSPILQPAERLRQRLRREPRPVQRLPVARTPLAPGRRGGGDRKSTRLNSSHVSNSYAVFCLKKKNIMDARPYKAPR